MREVELKAVVDDWTARRRRLESGGATLTFAGRLEDRRYDTPERTLRARDQILRVRTYRPLPAGEPRSSLDWKGPASYRTGYKVRDELTAATRDADSLTRIIERLGYVVSVAIDREIAQYELRGAVVRLERYPRMDELVEVEGAPEAIERAIDTLGMPRAAFTTERLADFVARFQKRTGKRAVLSDADVAGAAWVPLEDI